VDGGGCRLEEGALLCPLVDDVCMVVIYMGGWVRASGHSTYTLILDVVYR